MTAVELVERVIRALESHEVPYMAVGSFSSNVYGKPRSTKAADFVIQLGDKNIALIAQTLGPEFQLEPQMSFETITSTTRYRIVHPRSRFLVELFLLSSDPHDQERFGRRVFGDLGGFSGSVASAEDVVITKLRWSRHEGRSKDLEDVQYVLKYQAGRLDLPHIRRWCDQHGTRDLFERLQAAAAGPSVG
jgi:hypothetical protein